MRVGVVALMHESNTFIRGTTTLADFEADVLLEGETVRQKLSDAHGSRTGRGSHPVDGAAKVGIQGPER